MEKEKKKGTSKTLKFVIALVVFIIVAAIFSINTDPEKIMKADSEKIEIVSMSETMLGDVRTVHVVVKNTSNKLAASIILKSVYYDANGQIVGTGNGGALNVPSGQTRTADVMAMSVHNPTKYNVEVVAVIW